MDFPTRVIRIRNIRVKTSGKRREDLSREKSVRIEKDS
jgi:hypothetical protein